MGMRVDRLATILAEEFERDNWGDIDPSLFSAVAELVYDKAEQLAEMDEDQKRDVLGMEAVLRRVLSRLDS